MGHGPTYFISGRYNITDTIPGLLTRSAGGTEPLIPLSSPEARLGHELMAVQPNCPKENQPGSRVSPAAVAERRMPSGLDTHQGQRPCSSTILLEASCRLRHPSRRLDRKRDGGSRFDEVASTERTLLAAGEACSISSSHSKSVYS